MFHVRDKSVVERLGVCVVSNSHVFKIAILHTICAESAGNCWPYMGTDRRSCTLCNKRMECELCTMRQTAWVHVSICDKRPLS
jgi:hypothetical protein